MGVWEGGLVDWLVDRSVSGLSGWLVGWFLVGRSMGCLLAWSFFPFDS